MPEAYSHSYAQTATPSLQSKSFQYSSHSSEVGLQSTLGAFTDVSAQTQLNVISVEVSTDPVYVMRLYPQDLTDDDEVDRIAGAWVEGSEKNLKSCKLGIGSRLRATQCLRMLSSYEVNWLEEYNRLRMTALV